MVKTYDEKLSRRQKALMRSVLIAIIVMFRYWHVASQATAGLDFEEYADFEDAKKALALEKHPTGVRTRYVEGAAGRHQEGSVLYGRVKFGRAFCRRPRDAKFRKDRAFVVVITSHSWDNREGTGVCDSTRRKLVLYTPRAFRGGTIFNEQHKKLLKR